MSFKDVMLLLRCLVVLLGAWAVLAVQQYSSSHCTYTQPAPTSVMGLMPEVYAHCSEHVSDSIEEGVHK